MWKITVESAKVELLNSMYNDGKVQQETAKGGMSR